MDWKIIVANVITILGPVLGALLLGLATLAVHYLAKKFKLQNLAAVNEGLDTLIQKAVQSAEEWANTQKDRPTGNAKADYALSIVKGIASNEVVKKFTDVQLKQIIDAKVYELINK